MKRLKVEIVGLSGVLEDSDIKLYEEMAEEFNEKLRQTFIDDLFESNDVTVKSEIIEEASQ